MPQSMYHKPRWQFKLLSHLDVNVVNGTELHGRPVLCFTCLSLLLLSRFHQAGKIKPARDQGSLTYGSWYSAASCVGAYVVCE